MLLNRVKAATATATAGTVTLGAAVVPFQAWAAGGAVDGSLYSYLIEDGTAWELGRGIYAAGADTLTRPGPGVDATFASSTGALLVLSGAATVANAAIAADFVAAGGGGGGAGGGGALELLEVLRAAGGETVLSATGIPGTYGDLKVVVSSNASDVQQLEMTFNADVAADYDYAQYGSGFSPNQSYIGVGYSFPAATSPDYFTTAIFDIVNYAKTDRWKMVLGQAGQQDGTSTGNMVEVGFTAKWRNTAAVDRLDFTLAGGATYSAGSEVRIYGVRATPAGPTVVQDVFTHIQGNGQPVTLPAAPTPGNTLVAIVTGAGDASLANVPVHGADWNVVTWVNNSNNPGNPGSGPQYQCFSLACKTVGAGDPATFDYNSANGANIYLVEFQGRVAVDSTGVYALSTATGQLVLSACGSPLSDGMQLVVVECDGGNEFTFADGAITKLYEAPTGEGHYGVVGRLPAGYDTPILVNYTSVPSAPLGAVVSVAPV